MSHVISMHRPDDSRQTAVSDLSEVILCVVASRFEHGTSVVSVKQHNYSAIEANLITIQSLARLPGKYVECGDHQYEIGETKNLIFSERLLHSDNKSFIESIKSKI
jgi:hypothetical protein